MNILSRLLRKKGSAADTGWRVGGIEDFMTLIRVYYQAIMAAQTGITNLSMLPDLRIFKQTLHVPTANNKLGIGEKNRCKKMLMEIYGLPEAFFKEIDASVKHHCRNMNEVRPYLIQFQAFSQELMMLMGNLMKWKFRLPGFFKNALRTMTAKTIHEILTKHTWKDEGVRKTCISIRHYQHALGYSEAWMTEYVYRIVLLAKKEPKPSDTEEK